VVGEADNGAAALTLARDAAPDVVLLDIRMPGIDGLETAQHLARLEQPPAVIFTTAYGDHALQAFDAHAADYLLKPIRRERLREALTKAQRPNRAQLLSMTATGAPRARSHISVSRAGTIELIPVADIIYFEAEQKYVTVHHRHGTALIEDSLRTLEDELAGQFLRVHRKYLVALAALAGIEKTDDGHFAIIVRDIPRRLPVSRRQLGDVRQALKAIGARL
jgi:two-component system response regulator AlgR